MRNDYTSGKNKSIVKNFNKGYFYCFINYHTNILYTHFKEINDLIKKSSNIILTTHVVPDGDAIGSVMAFAGYLKQKGKDPVIINHSATPDNLKFLDRKNTIRVFSKEQQKNEKLLLDADVIFILDTNDFARTKSMEPYIINSPAKKVCIDHHMGLKPKNFDYVITNTVYPATCQILYEFIKDDDEKYLTKEVSSALYVGIMTDTGSFRHPRTGSDVFMVCAELINDGADPVKLYEEIYGNTTNENLQLMAKFISGLEFYTDNKVVLGTVTQKDFKAFGLDIDHVEGFTSLIMNIKGVKLGIILVELKDNIKVSFRSKGNIAVNKLAMEFKGGGHKNAAGANVKGSTIRELKEQILKKAENYIG